MKSDYEITDMHLDVLKEIGNIGAAHAATSLSQLLGRKIEMHVPKVSLVSFDEMFELAGGAERIVAGIYLRIQGDLSGSMFFVLPIDSANRIGPRNVEAVKNELARLSIPIIAEDTGGSSGRTIEFDPMTSALSIRTVNLGTKEI
ncbi:chemotaxis protein CheC [Sporosarcina luteola]|nr:chemotaxis protein CheC [Sporosarcina luteola]MCM3637854.1 chemotaxis protein CheC [Sporosarcina luteola]